MTANKNTQADWIIWGTGDLCARFWRELANPQQVRCFVDSNGTGSKFDKPVISPDSLVEQHFKKLFICSSWLNDIIATCQSLGIATDAIYVVQPRSLEVVPFSQFDSIAPGNYYYLPWKAQAEDIELSLSSDIVHPDVYKELAKSVGYCFISSVEGDFAEFGTCSGYTASLLARSINFYSQRMLKHEQAHAMAERQLCLFDSFQGFPEATLPEDLDSPHVASGMWGAGTAKGLNAQELGTLCGQYLPEDRVTIFEGWYKDTLSQIDPQRQFAFVHMDCDLYESTIDVLRHLFAGGHLAEGAMLLFDNWFCNKASSEYGERKAWQTLCSEFDIDYTNLGMYACVGNRIHHPSLSTKISANLRS